MSCMFVSGKQQEESEKVVINEASENMPAVLNISVKPVQAITALTEAPEKPVQNVVYNYNVSVNLGIGLQR